MSGKALCLNCSEGTAILKECDNARYYSSKHKEKNKNCVDPLRREKVPAL